MRRGRTGRKAEVGVCVVPAVSESQRRLFGLVVALKERRRGVKASKRVKKIARGISLKAAKDFGRKY